MKKILKISLVLLAAALISNPFSTNADCNHQGIQNGYCLIITEKDEEGNPIRTYLSCSETLPEGEEGDFNCQREEIIT
jgi:hypothetical protein